MCSLYEIYKVLEEELDRNSSHPAVAPIYFPQELARLESLERDLEHFFGSDWRKRVIVPAATHRYEQRLRKVSKEEVMILKVTFCVGSVGNYSVSKKKKTPKYFRLAERARSCWWPTPTPVIWAIYPEVRCWGRLPRNLWG